ncbi:MAG: BamA/TamA family outer membrane protein [Bryobacterales bacterium]|nr:BamA/TamA family outer membrane protein [Bryobacterales bacterium]
MLILVSCSEPAAGWAGGQDYEGKQIRQVLFEPKQQPLTPAELDSLTGLKRNTALRLAAVRSAIAKLVATGRYSDVAVDAALEDGQVVLRFLTKGNWFVGQVSVSSVPAPPGIGQMVNATGLDLGAPFHQEDLQSAEAGLRRVLSANGYFNPTIDALLSYQERTQQAAIRFEVTPGVRSRFGEPVIVGDPKRPPSEITGETGWKGWFGWRPITEARLQRGLEKILQSYRKRHYLMARATLLGVDPATGKPTVEVDAGPLVLIEAAGAKVSQGRLRRLLPVFEEQAVDRDLLVEGAGDLTGYFQTQGYFEAKVDFTSSQEADGRLRVRYTIDRGERHKLAGLTITGNRYFDLATLRERLLIAPASFQVRRGRFSSSLLARDEEAIRELYRANGFRDVKVDSRVEHNYRGKRGDMAVFLEIQEGGQWFISQTDFEGVGAAHEPVLRSILQSGPGQPFSEANVAADRDNILAHYFNSGYPNASFEWSFRETGEANRVHLRFTISEGPQLFVREVLISGLQTTHPQLVNRRIGINVGDPLSQTQLLETQRRLYDLGIFAKVDSAIQNPEGEERQKFVLLQMEESRKYSVALGFGAEVARIGGSQTSLESPAGATGFSPRLSFDVSRLNLFGRAHTASLRSRLSNLQQRGLISYTAAQFQGRPNVDLSFTAMFDSSRDIRTFSSRRWEGSTQLTHRWTRSKTFFYRFAYRRVSVDQGTLKIRTELIPLLSQPVRVGVFSASYLDDRRDDPSDSRRGTYNSLDLGVATRALGSQTDYFRLLGRNSTYHPIGSKLVLARMLSFGFLHTLRTRPDLPPSPQDIPLPERLFAGGASVLRAFPDNQAGPRDLVTGFPLGGKALLAVGTELRFPLFRLWGQDVGGVLFHDAGNIYSGLADISVRARQRNQSDFDYMVHAVGLGFRLRTPIGPVRTDFSFGPNTPRFRGCQGTIQELQSGPCEPTDQRINRFQFHFSLGQSF